MKGGSSSLGCRRFEHWASSSLFRRVSRGLLEGIIIIIIVIVMVIVIVLLLLLLLLIIMIIRVPTFWAQGRSVRKDFIVLV